MDAGKLQQAIELYDRFTHEGMDRRDFFARMTLIAGSTATASSLIASIAASPAAAAVVPADDPRLFINRIAFGGHGGAPGYELYAARARGGSAKRPTVLVIHENRGLNDHIKDVARRIALAGFNAVAPDMLSPLGRTPSNEDQAREMIGKLDLGASVSHAVQMLEFLRATAEVPRDPFRGNGKVGAVGFCWGGAFVNRLAVAAGDRLDAGVVYYGPAPDSAEATKVQAPLLIHHAGTDARVAATLFPWVSALRAAGKPVTYQSYDGAHHAFNNDTSAERYNKHAADLAWGRTIRFLKRHLR